MSNEPWKPSDAEYYACKEWLSHSEWKYFVKSPKSYQRHVVDGLPFKKSDAMEFGSAVDAAAFHPDGYGAGVVVIPDEVLASNGARAGSKWKEFAAANQGKILVKSDDKILYVLESLTDHEEANAILACDGQAQPAFRWETEVNGVPLKRRAKLDKLAADLSFIADLKTTNDPSPEAFAKTIMDLRYYTQAVWYQDAVEAHHGVRPPFLIIAVQNCEPFDCEVYELNDTFIALGRKLIDEKLREFVDCRESDTWRRRSHGKITKLAPPYWAERALQDWTFQGVSA